MDSTCKCMCNGRPVPDAPPKLEVRVKGRKVREREGHYELREPAVTYKAYFTPENGPLSVENMFYFGELAE